MICFHTGIKLTKVEHLCLLHSVADADVWVNEILQENIRFSHNKLCARWERTLFLDPAVEEIPADMDEQAAFIIAQPNYRTRLQRDAELPEPEEPSLRSTQIYNATTRGGGSITICTSGIEISDAGVACLMSRIQDINDWILGAILGKIHKSRGAMKRQYLPILIADPSVTSYPADDDRLVLAITARADYMSMPDQKLELERRLRVEAEERDS